MLKCSATNLKFMISLFFRSINIFIQFFPFVLCNRYESSSLQEFLSVVSLDTLNFDTHKAIKKKTLKLTRIMKNVLEAFIGRELRYFNFSLSRGGRGRRDKK